MKKKRFVRFFFSVVYSFAFESLWKRLIILNVSAPHFQSKHGRKSQKQTEQKEFREKWKYNIVISRVRTHSTINSMDVKRRWRKRRRKKRPKNAVRAREWERVRERASFKHIRLSLNECKYHARIRTMYTINSRKQPKRLYVDMIFICCRFFSLLIVAVLF